MDSQATASQLNAIMIAERVTSIFSLLGIIFILSTFLLGRGFDKPINRLFFFASFSNLGMNIAALMSQDGISAGQNSSLCQFQAFAIQWFLGVDVLWALCMGFNVFLALFCGWSSERMRRQEWKYFVGCYGCSFIPALVYLFIKSKDRGKVYGPALLWCWIPPEWDFLRIATLYGVVWVALFFAMTIYLLAFRKVWKNRHELQGLFNPFNENPFQGIITTEVNITTTARHETPLEPSSPNNEPLYAFPGKPTPSATAGTDFDPYTVNIEVGPPPQSNDPSSSSFSPPVIFRVRSLTRNAALSETNPEAWLYARVAFLFFCALLFSWVPSSVNRLYSLVHPDRYNFGLNLTEALVLPLQGFCNAVVYAVTSRTACGNLWRDLVGGQRRGSAGSAGAGAGREANANANSNSSASGGMMGLGDMNKLERFKGALGSKKGEGRLDRFASRKASRRLGSDDSSVASLRGHSADGRTTDGEMDPERQ